MAGTNLTAWLRQHGRLESALSTDLERFLLRQAKVFLAALADVVDPQLDDVVRLFDVTEQTDAILAVAMPHLARGMASGAVSALSRRRKRKAKAFDPESLGDELDDFELPEYARDAIETALLELSEQGYWRDIQQATQTSIIDIVREGLEKGDAGHTIAKAIRQALGQAAKVRARAIARTESSGALNAGHYSGLLSLAQDDPDGLLTGKTWLAVNDNDTRADHSALHETTIDVKTDFDVGGSAAPYPAHHSLPPEQRVNCRCTVIGSFDVGE